MGYYDTTSHMCTVSRMTNVLQSMYQKSYKGTQFVEYHALVSCAFQFCTYKNHLSCTLNLSQAES